MVKKIAVYGTYAGKVPVHQRYWKWIYHRTGPKAGQKWYKRRVWKKTTRLKRAVLKGRYEFHGRGRHLYQAVILAHQYMPKGYIDVPADKFVRHPEQYGQVGRWIDREVES
jgi:hypothetical protein